MVVLARWWHLVVEAAIATTIGVAVPVPIGFASRIAGWRLLWESCIGGFLEEFDLI